MKSCAAIVIALGLSSMVAGNPLHAEEFRAGVPLPGLESDPAGTVMARSSSVSLTAGTVSLVISVTSGEDMPALLLDSPTFGWTASDPYPDRQFPELSIRVEGSAMTPDERFEAFAGKTNITQLITLADMDPWAVTRTPPLTAAHPKNVQMLNGLRNLGAIEKSGDDFLAKWTIRRRLRIPLESIPAQRVELNYTARPSHSLISGDQLDTPARERSYCLSPKSLGRLQHAGSGSGALSVTEFTIATGIDGKPPGSVTFSLSPDADRAAPRAYLFFCGPHGKAVAQKGSITREPAEVDDTGILHVLSVLPATALR